MEGRERTKEKKRREWMDGSFQGQTRAPVVGNVQVRSGSLGQVPEGKEAAGGPSSMRVCLQLRPQETSTGTASHPYLDRGNQWLANPNGQSS